MSEKPSHDPTEIARRALRDIVDQKLPPTPENYARAYNNAAGIEDGLTSQSSVRTAATEAAADVLQGIIASVIQTTSDLSDGVEAWDKEADRILENSTSGKQKPDTAEMLQLILASVGALRQTVQKSHQELVETRAQVEGIGKDIKHFESVALTDVLTGLCNRRAMEDAMRHEIVRAKRLNAPLCLAILDMDYFKQINDAHGHHAGDQALAHIANIMRSVVRETDLVCRYGGEEFVILLPNSGVKGAYFVIDRLRIKIENTPLVLEHAKIDLSISGGIAELRPGEQSEELLQRADKALYHAKHNGRNQVMVT